MSDISISLLRDICFNHSLFQIPKEDFGLPSQYFSSFGNILLKDMGRFSSRMFVYQCLYNPANTIRNGSISIQETLRLIIFLTAPLPRLPASRYKEGNKIILQRSPSYVMLKDK
jgi:hypothetical protein